MFNMTKQEKVVIIFLAITATAGFGVLEYRNITQKMELKVEPANLTTQETNAEEIIRQNKIVNINEADIKQLCNLPGIGPKLAGNIIEYRIQNGPFKAKEDLMKAKGIGKKKFDRIKEFLTL